MKVKEIEDDEVALQVDQEVEKELFQTDNENWITMMILKKGRLQSVRMSRPLKFLSLKVFSSINLQRHPTLVSGT